MTPDCAGFERRIQDPSLDFRMLLLSTGVMREEKSDSWDVT